MNTPPSDLPGADHEKTVSDAEGVTADDLIRRVLQALPPPTQGLKSDVVQAL